MPVVQRRSGSRSGSRVAVVVVVVAVLLGAGGFAAWFLLLRSTPEKTMQAFLEAERKGDKAALKALLTTGSAAIIDQMEQASSKSGMPSGASAFMPFVPGTQSSYSVGASRTEGAKATVEVKMSPKGAGGVFSVTMPFILVKEGGQWKVDIMATGAEAMKTMQRMPGSQFFPAPGPTR